MLPLHNPLHVYLFWEVAKRHQWKLFDWIKTTYPTLYKPSEIDKVAAVMILDGRNEQFAEYLMELDRSPFATKLRCVDIRKGGASTTFSRTGSLKETSPNILVASHHSLAMFLYAGCSSGNFQALNLLKEYSTKHGAVYNRTDLNDALIQAAAHGHVSVIDLLQDQVVERHGLVFVCGKCYCSGCRVDNILPNFSNRELQTLTREGVNHNQFNVLQWVTQYFNHGEEFWVKAVSTASFHGNMLALEWIDAHIIFLPETKRNDVKATFRACVTCKLKTIKWLLKRGWGVDKDKCIEELYKLLERFGSFHLKKKIEEQIAFLISLPTETG